MGEEDESMGFKSFYYEEESGLRSVKSIITIDRNVEYLCEYISDLDKMENYDPMFDYGKTLRVIDDRSSIRYLKYKGKFMISSRDFVIGGRIIKKENEIILLLANYQSEKYPKNKDFVRADMKIAGFVLKKIEE